MGIAEIQQMALLEAIDKKRNQLNNMTQSGLNKVQTVKFSQELDMLINDFYNLSFKKIAE